MAVTELIQGHRYKLDIPAGAFTTTYSSQYLYVTDLTKVSIIGGGSGQTMPRSYNRISIMFTSVIGPYIEAMGQTASDNGTEYYGSGCYCEFVFDHSDGSVSHFYPYLTDITPKAIKLKDNQGNVLYPKTSASLIDGLKKYVEDYFTNNAATPAEINEWLINNCEISNATATLSSDYTTTTFSFDFTIPPERIIEGIKKHSFCFRTCLFRHKLRQSYESNSKTGTKFGKQTRKYSNFIEENEAAGKFVFQYHMNNHYTPQVNRLGSTTMLADQHYSGSISTEELTAGHIERTVPHMPNIRSFTNCGRVVFLGYGIGLVYMGDDGSHQQPTTFKYQALSVDNYY